MTPNNQNLSPPKSMDMTAKVIYAELFGASMLDNNNAHYSIVLKIMPFTTLNDGDNKSLSIDCNTHVSDPIYHLRGPTPTNLVSSGH